MSKFAKGAIILALLLVGTLVWWGASSERRAPARSKSDHATAGASKGQPARREGSTSRSAFGAEGSQTPAEKDRSPGTTERSAIGSPVAPPASVPTPGPSRLVGRVLDRDGSAVSGVQVMAYRGTKRARMAVTDTRGYFTLGDLDGKYEVRILRGVRTRTNNHLVGIPGDYETGGPSIEIEFRGMRGRLLDLESKPVARGIIVARRIDEDAFVVAAALDKTGHFSFFDMEPGTFRLTYKTNIFGSEVMTVAGGESVSSDRVDVTLRLERGDTIEGIVVDEDQQPRARVWVRATVGTTLTGATTDAEGRFVVKGLRSDAEYTLTTWLTGYVPERRTGVRPGTRGVHFRLDAGQTSTGRLLHPDGKPVVGAALQIRDQRGHGLPLYPKTDASGGFTLNGLPDETIRISTRFGRLSGSWEFRAGERELDLRLADKSADAPR